MDKSDISRDQYMLKGSLTKKGYDWWWHSFTAYNKKTGKPCPFFIEFFIINPDLGGKKPIFGQLKENRDSGRKPSYVMVKAGAWGDKPVQLHGFYGIDDLQISKGKMDLKVGSCSLSETSTKGSITAEGMENHPEYMSDNGKMKWDLKISKRVAFNVGYGASAFFRKINCFSMFWHAEGMKTEYSGSVWFNNEEYEVIPEKSYGYADKNWGSDFTSPWVWISSCNLKSRVDGRSLKNSVFDAGGGCPIVFGIPIKRKLLIGIHYEGKNYEFNFSKLWKGVKTTFQFQEDKDQVSWHIETRNFKSRAIIDCVCDKKEMLLINYEGPDGMKRHNCLWNGGNGHGRLQLFSKVHGKEVLIDDMDFYNAGCEYGEYDDDNTR